MCHSKKPCKTKFSSELSPVNLIDPGDIEDPFYVPDEEEYDEEDDSTEWWPPYAKAA